MFSADGTPAPRTKPDQVELPLFRISEIVIAASVFNELARLAGVLGGLRRDVAKLTGETIDELRAREACARAGLPMAAAPG